MQCVTRTHNTKFRVTLVSRNKAVSCMVLIERSTKVQNKHRMSTETAKENRTQLQSDESHQNINVRLKEERVREMQEWAGFCNGYLDDQFSRAEFKKFLDGLGTCVMMSPLLLIAAISGVIASHLAIVRTHTYQGEEEMQECR